MRNKIKEQRFLEIFSENCKIGDICEDYLIMLTLEQTRESVYRTVRSLPRHRHTQSAAEGTHSRLLFIESDVLLHLTAAFSASVLFSWLSWSLDISVALFPFDNIFIALPTLNYLINFGRSFIHFVSLNDFPSHLFMYGGGAHRPRYTYRGVRECLLHQILFFHEGSWIELRLWVWQLLLLLTKPSCWPSILFLI